MTPTLLKSILTFSMLGQRCAEQTIIDNNLQYAAKEKMKLIAKRFEGVEKDITLSISTEFANIIRNEVTQNWETFSFMNILHMVMSMTDQERAKVEEFCGNLLAVK